MQFNKRTFEERLNFLEDRLITACGEIKKLRDEIDRMKATGKPTPAELPDNYNPWG